MTRQWDDFDCSLVGSLSELPPPEEALNGVTPWREAMDHIVAGLCLTCFTLRFLGLQYLLPAVGTMELYLGFRSLRTANQWFRFSWYISAIKGIFLYAFLLLAATPLHSALAAFHAVTGIPLTLLLLFCFRQGLRQITRETSAAQKDPALWALVWYGVLLLLAVFWPQPGWIVFGILIFAFGKIVKALQAAAAELESAGYALRAAPVRVSAGRLKAVCCGSLLTLVLLAGLVSNHRPLPGMPAEQAASSPENAAIQTELAELGFDRQWSDLLAAEDRAALRGAVRVDDSGIEEIPSGSDGENRHENRVFFFLMPDGDVRVLHFFSLSDESGLWQEHLLVQSNTAITNCTARLFYSQGGQEYTARLTAAVGEMTSGLDFFGSRYQECSAAFEPFSWPLFSGDRRGYVLFTAGQEANPETTLWEQLNYRSDGFPSYPYSEEMGRADWSYGRRCYYGDGSGLVYKADEAAQ